MINVSSQLYNLYIEFKNFELVLYKKKIKETFNFCLNYILNSFYITMI